MQNSLSESTTSSSGFILLDSSMKPIFINPAAAEILLYPETVETRENLCEYLASKLESMLFSGQRSCAPAVVTKFRSGKRLYLCRSFWINTVNHARSQPSLAVLFERAPQRSVALTQLSEKFHLTGREQEVSQYLLQGLTSKEIAMRMEISPNTVKAFLRLIMVKMGVSTRCEIVAKAYSC
jgi:DNA-binding CsgD family transcriptional regulator